MSIYCGIARCVQHSRANDSTLLSHVNDNFSARRVLNVGTSTFLSRFNFLFTHIVYFCFHVFMHKILSSVTQSTYKKSSGESDGFLTDFKKEDFVFNP